jgi:hypothetical protein
MARHVLSAGLLAGGDRAVIAVDAISFDRVTGHLVAEDLWENTLQAAG